MACSGAPLVGCLNIVYSYCSLRDVHLAAAHECLGNSCVGPRHKGGNCNAVTEICM